MENYKELSEAEKLELFKVEELESRLELGIWKGDDCCTDNTDAANNAACCGNTNGTCGGGGGGGGPEPQ